MKIVAAGIVRDITWGYETVTFVDDPDIALTSGDFAPRQTSWVRQIILHTTTGTPHLLVPGAGKPGGALQTIDAWQSDPRHAGAHFVIDYDGTIYQCADIVGDAAYHAGPWNQTSVGIEVKVERGTNHVYEVQNEACADLVDVITAMLGIQRMVPINGVPLRVSLAKEVIGVLGHCHLLDSEGNTMRGPWDPGPYLLPLLARRGYEEVSYNKGALNDQWNLWASRQPQLGLLADGIPGPKTVTALHARWDRDKAGGFSDGLRAYRVGQWISRKCDDAVADAMGWI